MKLEIYCDLLFLEVAVWNFCVLCLTNETVLRSAGKRRIYAGALISAGIYVAVLFLPASAFVRILMEVAGTLVTVAVIFPTKGFLGFLKVVENYWICGCAWGGAAWILLKFFSFLKKDAWGVPFITLLQFLLLRPSVTWLRRRIKNGGREGTATLINGTKKICVKAILDTGNSLKEPISGKPTCVLDGLTAKQLWTGEDLFRAVPWHGVGDARGILKAYFLPELRLDLGGLVKVVRNVYVAVAPEEGKTKDACLIIQPKILE